MKKLTLALYAIWFSAILIIAPIHSMENHAQFAAQAEKYNADECLFLKLPNEMLFKIFLHRFSDDELSIDSLYDDVKHLMPLNAICKHFNQLITFETIACLYKETLNKNEVLRKVIVLLECFNNDKFIPILAQVLIYAGADANTICDGNPYALELAIRLNEVKLVETLLKYSNLISMYRSKKPIIFKAKTIPIARMLMDTGKIDIYATDKYGSNVLHNMTPACYPPALMKFYLNHKVDATQLTHHNFCILHEFAGNYFHYLSETKNMLEKIKILLNVVPHMINALTIDGKTPIDIVQEEFDIIIDGVYCGNPSEVAKQKDSYCEDFEKIIKLFRDHDGLTAQELAEKNLLEFHK